MRLVSLQDSDSSASKKFDNNPFFDDDVDCCNTSDSTMVRPRTCKSGPGTIISDKNGINNSNPVQLLPLCEAPWYLRFNPYITEGYRGALDFTGCLRR